MYLGVNTTRWTVTREYGMCACRDVTLPAPTAAAPPAAVGRPASCARASFKPSSCKIIARATPNLNGYRYRIGIKVGYSKSAHLLVDEDRKNCVIPVYFLFFVQNLQFAG
ncbi:hypothetical protein EVAR_33660_1 [Eumeta japonica]|uniref:Uncharacterized protein n=1 Tax=Eumeta variegata TaxID=151549 RepID=A0A4C1VQK7_EUMVA|nr:hypothetical protein EVAR_33660_1 [Eumeta japonica]